MLRCSTLIIALLLYTAHTFAQVAPSEDFLGLLDAADLQLGIAPDNTYRELPLFNRFDEDAQHFDMAFEDRKSRIEVRYLVDLMPEGSDLAVVPHVLAMTLAMNLATNDEDSYMTARYLDGEELAAYHADFATMINFVPNERHSRMPHGQLIAMYREGRGMAYICLFFKKANDALDEYNRSLTFEEDKPVTPSTMTTKGQ